MDFQSGLTGKAKPEIKGPAVLAAGVFDIYIYIYIYISKCGEYRWPLSFQLGLFGQPPLKVHGERSKLPAQIQQTAPMKIVINTLMTF